ncbi:low-density lipoprotein receptor-related protein 2-like [Nasonia vitripennis]|uniref:Vitellogenin receptor n=1 Tax=Nasonia vitripennis TaxID=7425 RepID=A0A7M7IWQ8_NASVI|nr:low-density lipoprotein receptor-related protein 2-like [Nasonia vitripennis]
MQATKILLFVAANCLFISAAKSNENVTTNKYSSDERLFVFSPWNGFFYVTEHSADHPVRIVTLPKTKVANLDYHAPSKTLFFTSPRFGYWTKNAKLYSVPWDSDFICQNKSEGTRQSRKAILKPFNCSVDNEGHLTMYKDVRGEIKELHEEENWNPRSLAVDYVANKLYIVDTSNRAINVFDLDGQNKATVFHNESLIPFEVAVDSPRGLMFILAANVELEAMQIYRANMDGTSRQLIVSKVESLGNFTVREKFGFAISPLKKRIFFANFNNAMVESVDYDGNGRAKVAEAKAPLTITVYNETLYWSDANTSASKLYMCINKECNIWTCQLNGTTGTCLNDSIKLFEEGKELLSSHGLKSVETRPQSIQNPCAADNGGCQHQCLIKQSNDESQSNHGCACKEGYFLTENFKDCIKLEVQEVYEEFYIPEYMNFSSLTKLANNSVFPVSKNLLNQLKYETAYRILYQSPFRFLEISHDREDIFEDSHFPEDTLTSNPNLSFMFSLLGLGDVRSYNCHTRREHDSPALRSNENGFAGTLAFDWVTKNLYYAKLSNNSDDLAELTVLKLDRPERLCFNNSDEIQKYVSPDDVYLAEIPEPVHMVVHPYRGYVYASLKNGSVIRLNTDGSNKIILGNINDSVLLATDLTDDKLFWLDSHQYVNFANLDGTSPKRLFKSPANKVVTLRIFGDWVYVKDMFDLVNADEIKIWRFDKLTGQESGNLDLSRDSQLWHDSVGIKVSAKDARKVDVESHPCVSTDEPCESFCFAVPRQDAAMSQLKRVCACGTDQKLQENGSSCHKM